MIDNLIDATIYYRVFDLSFANSTHIYNKTKVSPEKYYLVEQNISSVTSALKANNMLLLNQVHGNSVCDADYITDFSLNPDADAAITSKPKLALSIQTADCAPILLYCTKSKIIGAAHAGWRGAKSDIVKNVVEKMQEKGAKEIHAIIGPTIALASYEVDVNFYNDFIETNASYYQFFINSKNPNKYMFDLQEFITIKLQEAYVIIDDIVKEDTYVNHNIYPSYRRCTHLGQKLTGSILSTIMII